MIFSTPKGIEKEDLQRMKFESKRDKQIEKALTHLKDSGELERRVRGLSHESLHIVHNFLEREERAHEGLLDAYKERANKTEWGEIFMLAAEAETFLTAAGTGVGVAVGADPATSGLVGLGAGAVAAYPLWKWLAKKDVERNENKTAFLQKLRELIHDEWKQRGAEVQE